MDALRKLFGTGHTSVIMTFEGRLTFARRPDAIFV